MYHFDYDSFNFLKIMIYLSDVDTKSGPHTYIKGSQKPFSVKMLQEGIPLFGRYLDEQVYSIFGKQNEAEICGDAGTVILVDTSGFHKGKPLEHNRNRVMAQLEYVDCGIQFGRTLQGQK